MLSCINIGVSTIPLRKCGKSMPAKKFFINTGINITVKTNNRSYARRKKSSSTPLCSPLQISQFSERIKEISGPNSQNAQKIDVDILKRSFKDILTIIRSSCLIVIGGLPVLGFGFSVLSALNLLITRWTTFFDLHTMPAISEYDLSSSWFVKWIFFFSS